MDQPVDSLLLAAIHATLEDADGPLTAEQILSIIKLHHEIIVEVRDVNITLRHMRSQGLLASDANGRWAFRSSLDAISSTRSKTFTGTRPAQPPLSPPAKSTSISSTPISNKSSAIQTAVPEFSQLRKEFVQSLQQEIDLLKRGKAGLTVTILEGRPIRTVADTYVYLFRLESFLSTIDDSPGELKIGNKAFDCQIITVDGMHVELSVQSFLGDFVPVAKLTNNLWYLLEMLRKKFAELDDSAANLFITSQNLFRGNSNSIPVRDPSSAVHSNSKLNPSQLKAVSKSLQRSVSVIWGPPGTGKTLTIAAAVEAQLQQGRRVLLVSHANTAVDEAMEKIAAHFKEKDKEKYDQGRLVRVGTCRKKSLEEQHPMVVLGKIIESFGKTHRTRKEKLSKDCLLLEAQIEACDKFLRELSLNDKLRDDRDNIQQGLPPVIKRIEQTQHDTKHLEELIIRTEKRYNDAIALTGLTGNIKKMLLGLDPQTLSLEITRMRQRESATKSLLEELQDDARKRQQDLKRRQEKIEQSDSKLSGLLKLCGKISSSSQVSINKQNLVKSLRGLRDQIAEINRYLDQLEDEILSKAILVATTLTKTFSYPKISRLDFDVMILDESSMAPLPAVYWAAHRVSTAVIVVGDFKQLPPIAQAKDDASSGNWLGRSIFDVLEIDSVSRALKSPIVAQLNVQYRMAPDIARIVNSLFYENELRDDPSTKQLIMTDRLSGSKPLVLVDTTAANPWCNSLSEGSRFNLYSALVSVSLARTLLADEGVNRVGSIGIMTPYRAQARLMEKIAADWGMSSGLRINTVHSFQGGEEPVIVFDCVDGPGLTNKYSMLDRDRADLLLNVALTRARSKFYLVANKRYIETNFQPSSYIRKIISSFTEFGKLLPSSNIVDGFGDKDFEKWLEAALQPSAPLANIISVLLTEKSFWPIFHGDLVNAKEGVIIMSPFIALRRATDMLRALELLRKRNVDVLIYTRPPADHVGRLASDASQFVERCKSLGIAVVLRRKMHHKIAIIDNKILWEGSLNILSQNDSSEHMRRLEGSSTVNEVLSKLELDQPDTAVGVIVDKLCPKCQSALEIVEGRYGKFYGCTSYARTRCSYRENITRRPNQTQRNI